MKKICLYLYFYVYHFIIRLSWNDMCFCQYDDPNFGFKSDSGLYCCQKTKEQCTDQYSWIDYHPYQVVSCTGEALNLTQQCHNQCNFYGFDKNRNHFAPRSFLDICKVQYKLRTLLQTK